MVKNGVYGVRFTVFFYICSFPNFQLDRFVGETASLVGHLSIELRGISFEVDFGVKVGLGLRCYVLPEVLVEAVPLAVQPLGHARPIPLRKGPVEGGVSCGFVSRRFSWSMGRAG